MPETQQPPPPQQPTTTAEAAAAGPRDTRVDLTERGESVRRTDMRGAYDPNTATDADLSTAMFGLFIASIIVFGTVADQCNDDNSCDDSQNAWAITAGVVSAAFALLWLFFRHMAKLVVPPVVDLVLALFLVIWWAFGVGFNTGVGGPFDGTNNGYWASWVALFLSVYYLASAYVRMGRGNFFIHTFHHSLMFILFASIVVLAVCADICTGHHCGRRVIWGIVLGCVSAVLVFIQILLSHFAYNMAQATGRIIGTLLLLLWIFGAAFLTSVPDGPFHEPCDTSRPGSDDNSGNGNNGDFDPFDPDNNNNNVGNHRHNDYLGNANGFYATWIAFAASAVYFWRVVIHNVPEERA